jgi:glycerol-3-phosphate dehydrogenase (NAD(P)+)
MFYEPEPVPDAGTGPDRAPRSTLPHTEAAPGGRATLAVLGAGAWGTVIAHGLAAEGHRVRLWCRRPEVAAAIASDRANEAYVPGLRLPDSLRVTALLDEAVDGVEAALVVVPSRGMRALLDLLPDVPALISATKGFAGDRLTRMTELMHSAQPHATVAALSGPNLAAEIARGLPAAATIACTDEAFARRAQGWLSRANLRVYASSDVAGVEACGALKNVIALAAGMSDGLGLGDNAHAALLTRGLAELVRVGTALGGDARTFYGLAGVGDLVATCGSAHSRNHQVGWRVARGERIEDVLEEGITAEGLATVRHVVAFAEAAGLDLPISREVHRVVYERKAPDAAIRSLMTRAPRGE